MLLLDVVLGSVGRDARAWTVGTACNAELRSLCGEKNGADIWGLTRFKERSILYDLSWLENDQQADAIIQHECAHAFSWSGQCKASTGKDSRYFAAAHKIVADCYTLLFTEGV